METTALRNIFTELASRRLKTGAAAEKHSGKYSGRVIYRWIMNLYELYDGEEYIGEYTARQIEEITGYDRNHISGIASAGTKIRKRYRVERTGDRKICQKDWLLLMEFENTARWVLKLLNKRKEKK